MTTHIRIPAVTPTVQTVADGTSKTFDFPFPIFAAADLEVFVGDALIASGFTVRGAGSSEGGAVTFAAAPANGQRVTIRRRQALARTDDFPDERAPTPHELNDAVDQNVAALQELADESALAVKRSSTADLSRAVDLTLPEPEAGKVIGWNGSANGLVNLTQVDASDMLRKSQNLADLPDKAQARTNLGLGSAAVHDAGEFATAAQGAKADSALQASAIGTAVEAHSANLDWLSANLTNAGKALLDDADAAAQRATLGLAAVAASGSYTDLSNTPVLGSAAAHAATDFATAAQGAKADSALQPSAIDTDATLAANSDALVASQKAVKSYVDGKSSALDVDVLHKSQNLADLPDKAQARANLGLGSAATKDAGTAANQLVQLDASGKLPAVNGSAVTSLNAGALSSGTVASARLGSGTADSSTFLRGDGTWAPLSAMSGGTFGNIRTFTASGSFTVPAGVTLLLVLCVGGGGNNTAPGGATSFGSYIVANGGGQQGPEYGAQGVSGGGSYDASAVMATGTSTAYVNAANGAVAGQYPITTTVQTWGKPYQNGGQGSSVLGFVSVTPGQQISITIGGSASGASAGGCAVRW